MPSHCDSNSARRGKLIWYVALIPSLASLALFVATLRPEFDWGDSAELSLQAYQLGVTHPPGYPVHTFLGNLFVRILGEPMLATNVLSAVCTSLATGLLTLTAHRLTGGWLASILAGLTFALVPQVWDMAIVTEVYGVNICFVGLALFLLLSWYRKPSRALLVTTSAAFGVSLGTYLANVLILPAFVFLLVRQEKTRLTRIVLFLSVIAIVGGPILSWSYFRSSTVPPLGTVHVPDSPGRFLLFLTGAQYGTVRLHAPGFYVDRFIAHSQVFGRSFLWLGIVFGLVGLGSQWKEQRPICIALLIAFIANMAYFTTYAATDYYTMVTPSYFIFSLWIACGIQTLSRQAGHLHDRLGMSIHLALVVVGTASITAALVSDWFEIGKPGFGRAQALMLLGGCGLLLGGLALRVPRVIRWLKANTGKTIATLVSAATVAGLICSQLPTRLAQKHRAPVTFFVLSSFDVLPRDSIVVARWDKLAPLLYFQKTRGLRRDITIVEPISDWQRYVYDEDVSSPVIVDMVYGSIEATHQFIPYPHGWYQVALAPQLQAEE